MQNNKLTSFAVSTTSTITTFTSFVLLSLSLSLFSSNALSDDLIEPTGDPHYTDIGFFDIHVCNWPDRPLFFLTLFSSTFFEHIKRVEIQGINGESIGELDMDKFRMWYVKDKKDKSKKLEKRAMMKFLEIPEGSKNGWYRAVVTTKDGKQYLGKDYVVMYKMPRATGMNPPHDAQDVPMMKELTWNPVPGAKHYRVFINDIWASKTIFESPVLQESKLVLPKGLLKPGGLYEWRIHARDVNENILLGDFNHGSLTGKMEFSIAE